ncbi:uncharacterized protein LOC103521927 [Diaphorina citri]|uniref:Uncharacterized protein LOC103521927 n=1 Tax=Diaphorina citri TaxID=121845 RepID=A0A1S3DNB8_DIACI|nr:uncharacterized protein LOC103521927 [Diaphorina citri]
MGPGQDTSNQSLRSTQDEHVSMVGYMFPRDANDYVQATQHFINLKQQQRWALGDDSVSTDLSVDQQSPVPQQAGSTPQSAQGTTAQQQQLAAAQQVNAAAPQPMMFTQPIHPQLPPHLHQAIQFTQYRTNGAPPVTQVG